MAQLLDKSYELPALDFKSSVPWGEQPHDQKMKELQGVSDNLPEGEIVGGIISFGVADGGAYYLVTKAKPLILQHIDYGDGYRVQYPMIRGLRRADVEDMLGRTRMLNALFTGE